MSQVGLGEKTRYAIMRSYVCGQIVVSASYWSMINMTITLVWKAFPKLACIRHN